MPPLTACHYCCKMPLRPPPRHTAAWPQVLHASYSYYFTFLRLLRLLRYAEDIMRVCHQCSCSTQHACACATAMAERVAARLRPHGRKSKPSISLRHQQRCRRAQKLYRHYGLRTRAMLLNDDYSHARPHFSGMIDADTIAARRTCHFRHLCHTADCARPIYRISLMITEIRQHRADSIRAFYWLQFLRAVPHKFIYL